MRKTIQIVLGTIGATVLVLTAIVVALIAILRSSEDYEVIASTSSPDGIYTATFYEGAGGGAAGWYCATVVVAPSAQPFDLDHRSDFSRYEVFGGGIGDIKLRWISSRTLDIYFDSPHPGLLSIMAKRLNHDGKVIVQYSGAMQQFAAPAIARWPVKPDVHK